MTLTLWVGCYLVWHVGVRGATAILTFFSFWRTQCNFILLKTIALRTNIQRNRIGSWQYSVRSEVRFQCCFWCIDHATLLHRQAPFWLLAVTGQFGIKTLRQHYRSVPTSAVLPKCSDSVLASFMAQPLLDFLITFLAVIFGSYNIVLP